MTTASGALNHSRTGLVAAQADYDALPPVTTNPHEPQTDLERLMDPGGGLKQAKYDGERAEREKAAGVALTKLDTHFEKSAKDLRTVAGDAPSKSGGGGGGGGDESGGGSPLGRTPGRRHPRGVRRAQRWRWRQGRRPRRGDHATTDPRGPRDDGDPRHHADDDHAPAPRRSAGRSPAAAPTAPTAARPPAAPTAAAAPPPPPPGPAPA